MLTPTNPQHPRPQLQRAHWRSLDGDWAFSFSPTARPAEVVYDRMIVVPFAPESEASGVHDTGFHPVAWYRREVTLAPEERFGDLRLHFGAVDYRARVWVNGRLVAEHQGGHTPFSADLCWDELRDGPHGSRSLEIVVRAEDDPHDLSAPRGKQDWLREPHDIWYPRTTGIWQTVWLECLPASRLESLRWTPNLERWEIGLELSVGGQPLPDGAQLRLRLHSEGERLIEDTYSLSGGRLHRRVALPDPGIDSARSELLWSPEHPRLIAAELELLVGGEVIDRVQSYTALRGVRVQGGRFELNGRPYPLKMVLDQGYWPTSLMTAPNPEALRRDVELTRLLGFNGARKHQKIEDPRWLYWCDVLGLLVWAELPSAYSYSRESVRRLSAEWTEAIERDASHPCIVAWVPMNESWGVPDLPTNAAHRDLVQALYHLTRSLDPTRPVIGNDGWEQVATDLLTIHDYHQDAEVLRERYRSPETVQATVTSFLPGGRAIALPGLDTAGLPVIISEFGGVAYTPQGEYGWGYDRVCDASSFAERYSALLGALHSCAPTLAGFCYTQLTDTFQEANGLLTAERQLKAPLGVVAAATRGHQQAFDLHRAPDADRLGYSAQWRRRWPLSGQQLALDLAALELGVSAPVLLPFELQEVGD